MFKLNLDMLMFGTVVLMLLTITIIALIDAYRVIFVEECVKHRTRSLILLWSAVFAAVGWILVILGALNTSDFSLLNASNACLLATYMLLWPISNRRNLVSKNETSK